VSRLAAAGVPALKSSRMLEELTKRRERYPVAYLAHEYMGSAWQPLWVTEVRSAMAEIGLVPAGSATLPDNFDSFVLGREARETVAAIEDDDARELVRDFYITQTFRRDVFIRSGTPIDDEERRARLLASSFALMRPAASIEYSMATPAGRLGYDNAAAKAVVAALAGGPARLGDVARGSPLDAQDLLANALVLAAAGTVRPVEGVAASTAAVNKAIFRRFGSPQAIKEVAIPCGTALLLAPDLMAALCNGGAIDDGKFPGWRDFLSTHGL
jgi:Predicted methyltransferase regulatory domain